MKIKHLTIIDCKQFNNLIMTIRNNQILKTNRVIAESVNFSEEYYMTKLANISGLRFFIIKLLSRFASYKIVIK